MRDAGAQYGDLLDRLDGGPFREAEVHQNHIGAHIHDGVNTRLGRLGFARDLEPRCLQSPRDVAAARRLLIQDDDHPSRPFDRRACCVLAVCATAFIWLHRTIYRIAAVG